MGLIAIHTAVVSSAHESPRRKPAQVVRSFCALIITGLALFGVRASAQISIDPSHGVTLSWTDNSQNELSFRIERRTANGAYALLDNAPRAAGRGSIVTYRDTTVGGLTTYVYRVRAENSKGASAWTNEVTVATTAFPSFAITSQPVSLTSRSGSAAYFSVNTTTDVAKYQWYRNGLALAGETGSSLYISNVQAANAGVYTVTITTVDTTITSNPAQLSVVSTGVSRLINVSGRAFVSPDGDNQLIPGVVIFGSGQKKLLVRAVGPQLGSFGVTNFLPDPLLNVYRGLSVIASNDNWGTFADQTGLEAARVTAGAFALTTGSNDAAALLSLAGNGSYMTYTMEAAGQGRSGIGLVEVYDVDPDSVPTRVANLAVRGFVGTGDNVLTAGFVVRGDVATVLLIRGVGPGLTQFGVNGILPSPLLTLFRTSGTGSTTLASNSRWELNSNLTALSDATTRTGAFPLSPGSLDTALLVSLPPGSYTAQLEGQAQTTGVGLVELYVVP